VRRDGGRLFQTSGPQTANARRPSSVSVRRVTDGGRRRRRWQRSAEEAVTMSRESAEGAVAGECFDVGAVCDGAGSVLWAWLISSDHG